MDVFPALRHRRLAGPYPHCTARSASTGRLPLARVHRSRSWTKSGPDGSSQPHHMGTVTNYPIRGMFASQSYGWAWGPLGDKRGPPCDPPAIGTDDISPNVSTQYQTPRFQSSFSISHRPQIPPAQNLPPAQSPIRPRPKCRRLPSTGQSPQSIRFDRG